MVTACAGARGDVRWATSVVGLCGVRLWREVVRHGGICHKGVKWELLRGLCGLSGRREKGLETSVAVAQRGLGSCCVWAATE